jgi:hypothetical protein
MHSFICNFDQRAVLQCSEDYFVKTIDGQLLRNGPERQAQVVCAFTQDRKPLWFELSFSQFDNAGFKRNYKKMIES